MITEKKHVTFNDIAAYTHFSKTTISRYFNRPDTLSPESQAKIRQALKELDYKENKVAKILAKGTTEFVGILMPNLYIPFFSEMLGHILDTYEEYGYKFIVFVGDEKEDVERKYIEELIAYQVEGLIVMSFTLSSEELSHLPVPVVTIEREDLHVCSVNTDNYLGSTMACRHLMECGCEILLHINLTTTPHNAPAYQRIRGFKDFCTNGRIPHEVILREIGPDYPCMEKELKQILEEFEEKYQGLKKGIFFSDDTRANVFVNLLVRKYGCVPEEFQIVGYDNSPASQSAVYPITTVGQQIGTIANESVRLLLHQIKEVKEGKYRPPEKLPITHKVIHPVFIQRTTTKCREIQ